MTWWVETDPEEAEAGVGEPRLGLLEVGVESVWEGVGVSVVRAWGTLLVRDIPTRRRRTVLVWRRRRFECDGCGRTHVETHPQVRGKFTVEYAGELARETARLSIAAVSEAVKVGWGTIQRLVDAQGEGEAVRRRALPCRVLGVDETSIGRGHKYVTVLYDGEKGHMLTMLPGRSKATLTRFFRDQGPAWREGVEVVVTDGSTPYKAAIEQYLPKAQHVLDRFHVIRWFGYSLVQLRRDLQRRPHQERPQPGSLPYTGPAVCSSNEATASPKPNGNNSKACSIDTPLGNRMASPPRTLQHLPVPQPGGGLHSPRQVHCPLPNRPNTPIPQNRKNHPPLARPNPSLPHHRTGHQRQNRSRQQPTPKTPTHRPRIHQPPKLRQPSPPANLTMTPTKTTPAPKNAKSQQRSKTMTTPAPDPATAIAIALAITDRAVARAESLRAEAKRADYDLTKVADSEAERADNSAGSEADRAADHADPEAERAAAVSVADAYYYYLRRAESVAEAATRAAAYAAVGAYAAAATAAADAADRAASVAEAAALNAATAEADAATYAGYATLFDAATAATTAAAIAYAAVADRAEVATRAAAYADAEAHARDGLYRAADYADAARAAADAARADADAAAAAVASI